MGEPTPHLSAAEAAALLGVSLPTLYAYVSRGMLASEPSPGTTRARRYRRDEVERLRGRREGRRHPEQVASRALAWGEPVLDSALTLAAGGHLYYRGADAVALSRERSLEEVVALLWLGDAGRAADLFAAPALLPAPVRRALRGLAGLAPVERLQALLPLAAASDAAAWDLRREAVARCGVRVLRLATVALTGEPTPRAARGGRARILRTTRASAEPAAPQISRPGEAASHLAAAWCGGRRAAAEALAGALVLCADHELNVSTFACRCAASAEATPWDVVAAGLATLKGRRHGGGSLQAAALLRAAAEGSPSAVLAERLRSGSEVAGFGHPLHPAGDPRGEELLALAARVAPRAPVLRTARALVAAAERLLGERPNLDLGLATLAAALRLPAGAAMGIFALGRIGGWIAHALEEYARERLIRPRARYVGPPPALPTVQAGG